MPDTLSQLGYARLPAVLSAQACDKLVAHLGPVQGAGRRGLLDDPLVAQLATSETCLSLIRPHLSQPPRAVRAIYFDKSPASNWLVPWHQDLTLALMHKHDTPGYGPWSVKEGVTHAQAPASALENMLTLRLHLDDATLANGALRVLPGSHRWGVLAAADIAQLRNSQQEASCDMARGDGLLMKPLLLHASGKAADPHHRRVLHIEYAGFPLPDGLQWHQCL